MLGEYAEVGGGDVVRGRGGPGVGAGGHRLCRPGADGQGGQSAARGEELEETSAADLGGMERHGGAFR